jgi:CubicO group peptidase (beta-lactamase class C family)
VATLGALDPWPGVHAAIVVVARDGATETVEARGPLDRRFAHASVTKVATSLAVLVEVERGTCSLDEPLGPPGATLEHLLAHASGLPLEGVDPVAAPGVRRVYSNAGIDLAAAHAASRANLTPASLLASNVFGPLAMRDTVLEGRASSGAVGTVADLSRLAAELLSPTLLSPQLAARQRAVAFSGLVGVLPGFGRQEPCDWGLGVEVKGTKQPHWTGERWPADTVGHFGQAGGFVAADVDAGVAVATLGDAAFGPWAIASWPAFTDAARAAVDA